MAKYIRTWPLSFDTGCLLCDAAQDLCQNPRNTDKRWQGGMCPKHELEYLDACIERDMKRIEVLKQIIAKGEQNANHR